MNKKIQSSESLLLAVFLTLSGGFMDAYSYICRGEVFANAQTGNILLFGVNLSTGNFYAALRYLCPVIAFTAGIAAADFIRYKFKDSSRLHWRQIIVAAEAIILFVVGFFPNKLDLIANSLTSLACGAQVESFRKINGYGAATTMCIGNLRTATQAICEHFITRDKDSLRKSVMFFGVIGIFVIGAVLGNFAVGILGQKAIMLCGVFMFIAFIIMKRETAER
ncbi:MAG: YoaK family protein [Clostridia bacterium]|nr:YoaK family protein [Clostridia bacterium]